MKIIYNNILPIKGFYAINLFGILFVRKNEGKLDKVMLNHEAIHTRQMLELLIIPFYIWYIVEWLIRLIQYRNCFMAYKNISFEREAYAQEKDLKYLRNKRWYSFLKFL